MGNIRYSRIMPKIIDLANQTFGRLQAISVAPQSGRTRKWRCKCACGKTVDVVTNYLVSGHTRSCGCLHGQTTAARNFKHGQTRTKLHVAWSNMRDRCLNPKNAKYHRYGGRGIKICERWMEFAAFAADMGEPPKGLTLDRIDTDGDYTPDNCRWANYVTQNRNRYDNVKLTARGQTLCITEWERLSGNSRQTISRRIAKGWMPEDAIFRPVWS